MADLAAFGSFQTLSKGAVVWTGSNGNGSKIERYSIERNAADGQWVSDAVSLHGLSVSQDGKLAAVIEHGGQRRLLVLETETLTPVLVLPRPNEEGVFLQVEFHPGGTHLVTRASDFTGNDVQVRRLSDGRIERKIGGRLGRQVWLLAEGKWLLQAAEDWDESGRKARGLAILHRWETGKIEEVYSFAWASARRDNPWAAQVSRAGFVAPNYVAVSTGLPETRVWRLPSD